MADDASLPPGFKEELEEVSSEPRNWKGILIALLVIVSICALISLAILALSPHLGNDGKKEKLKLDDVLNLDASGSYPNKGSNATWISGSKILYRDLDGTIFSYDIDSDWKTVLASNFSLTRFKVEKYTLSPDHRYFLLVHDITSRNTYSIRAKFKIYDTKNSYIFPLNTSSHDHHNYHTSSHNHGSSSSSSSSGSPSSSALFSPHDFGEYDLQHVEWGPRGSQMLIVERNDLFYVPKLGDPKQQLTSSGQDGLVFNGIPDLMNEEFVLKKPTALWWLPSGDKLAYASFDNRHVDVMPIVVYGPTPAGDSTLDDIDYSNLDEDYDVQMYPRVVNYPYPKPARRIPTVTLWIVDLTTPHAKVSKPVTPPREIQSLEHYILDVTWVNNKTLAVLWSRRSYNMTLLSVCHEEAGWECEKLFEEHLPSSKGWLSIRDAPLFIPGNDEYYFMKLPVADGAAGTFDHVSMIYFEGNKRHFLTHGQFVVTEILAYRPDLHTLYFVASVTGDPAVRHVYSVVDMEDPERDRRRMTSCLSCDLGTGCLYNSAKFSPAGSKYYILECQGPGIPRTELRSVPDNSLIEILNTNPKMKEWFDTKIMPRIRYMSVPLPGGATARVELLLPSGVVESEASHHYPIVIELDGRPEQQSVNYQNKIGWGHYLASKRDYVVVHMDVRGSGYQGDKFKHKIYHHLGEYEAEDIMAVVKHLKENFQYLDEDKTAIYGKGAGAYLAVSLISRSSHFNCGVAVAPVTSWRNYASSFVEKYMGLPTPQDNYVNYDKTDLVRNLETIKEKQLLIVHGTGDRIVSIQHSMLLMKALTDKGVPYKIQIYPDGDHSLYRERNHLHQVMEELFAACFKVEDDEDDRFTDLPLTRVIKGGKKIIGASDD